MHRINIKGISLNNAYVGRRFASPALKQYKSDLSYLLPKITVPEGKLSLTLEFGVSYKSTDGDNLVKCFQDSIAEQYGFNDRQIYKWEIKKVDVKRKEEYIKFAITEYKEK